MSDFLDYRPQIIERCDKIFSGSEKAYHRPHGHDPGAGTPVIILMRVKNWDIRNSANESLTDHAAPIHGFLQPARTQHDASIGHLINFTPEPYKPSMTSS